MKSTDKKAKRGRPVGAVAKSTALTKSVIANMLDDYHSSGLFSEDFLALEPKDRVSCAEKMMQYVMPKMQSTAVDFNANNTKVTISQRLIELSKEPEEG